MSYPSSVAGALLLRRMDEFGLPTPRLRQAGVLSLQPHISSTQRLNRLTTQLFTSALPIQNGLKKPAYLREEALALYLFGHLYFEIIA